MKVQVQVVSEPDLGVGPGLDLNWTSILHLLKIFIITFITLVVLIIFKKWLSFKLFITRHGSALSTQLHVPVNSHPGRTMGTTQRQPRPQDDDNDWGTRGMMRRTTG